MNLLLLHLRRRMPDKRKSKMVEFSSETVIFDENSTIFDFRLSGILLLKCNKSRFIAPALVIDTDTMLRCKLHNALHYILIC